VSSQAGEFLDAYIKAAGIADDRNGPLFRAAIGCHTFSRHGHYRLPDEWRPHIEVAQRMAGHSNAKTTGLYDRRNDDISVGEVERRRIRRCFRARCAKRSGFRGMPSTSTMSAA
jgi:hypothetical protein